MRTWTNATAIMVVLLSGSLLLAKDKDQKQQERVQNKEQKKDQCQKRDMHEMRERTGRGPGGQKGRMGRENMLERLIENPMMVAKLELTEKQIAEMHAISEKSRIENEKLAEQMQAAGRVQAEAMTSDEVDESLVMKKVEEIGAIKTEMAKQQMRQLMALQQILTPEQRAKIKEITNKIREGMAQGGPDGERGEPNPEMKRKMEQRKQEMQKNREKGAKNKPGGQNSTPAVPGNEAPLFQL